MGFRRVWGTVIDVVAVTSGGDARAGRGSPSPGCSGSELPRLRCSAGAQVRVTSAHTAAWSEAASLGLVTVS